jgi:hypothetical protein
MTINQMSAPDRQNSGLPEGVYLTPNGAKYKAQFGKKHLGTFDDLESAEAAHLKALILHYWPQDPMPNAKYSV